MWFIKRCSKPDKTGIYLDYNQKEFTKIASSCAIGFAVMGVVGYIIKLVFIPINNIILSTAWVTKIIIIIIMKIYYFCKVKKIFFFVWIHS